MNLTYTLGALLTIPVLPLMYVQGKRVRATMPQLPDAKGIQGVSLADTPRGNLSLLTIGESTIAGVGVQTHQEGFSGSLAKELSQRFQFHVEWKVYARSGFTAKSVRKNLVPQIQETATNLIVIGLGANDAFTLNTPGRWRRHVRRLITDLQATCPEATIVFCNMPPIKDFPAFTSLMRFSIGNLVEILGKELVTLVREFEGVYYYDRMITLQDWIERFDMDVTAADFFSDGVHPSKLTYQTWAMDVAEEIERRGMLEKT